MKNTLLSRFSFLHIAPGSSSGAIKRRCALTLSLLALAVTGLAPVCADASLYYQEVAPNVTSLAPAPDGGFWIQKSVYALGGGDDGRTLRVDGAPAFENVPLAGTIVPIPGKVGYWIVTDDGKIIPRGDAPQLCGGEISDCSGFPSWPTTSQLIVGAAAKANGTGLWTVTLDGKVWTAGDAQSYGDVQSDSAHASGIVGTPSGKGYYIVLADGGVYSFGDAVFYGSFGGNPPRKLEVTGMALYNDDAGQVKGYWLVAKDGGVFAFGTAPFWGSTGGNNGGSDVISIASFPTPVPGRPQRTGGYAWVHAGGHIGVVHGTHW
jgi:hypothetical protein